MTWAIVATALAGAATIAGGALALHAGMRRRGALAVSLAFAAGVMIVLSVLEILPLSVTTLRDAEVGAPLVWTAGVFLLGAALVLLIDRFLPERIVRDPAHHGDVATVSDARSDAPGAELTGSHRLMRSGLLIALVIGAHNAPEGLMTFLAMLESPELGVPLAVAIAIHNVPEGIAVAAPIYVATGRRRPALAWAAVAGLAEPIGALVGYFALRVILPPQLLVLTLALVAGMMIALSLRELIPAARRYQTHPAQSLGGLVAGAGVVWSSLALTGAATLPW